MFVVSLFTFRFREEKAKEILKLCFSSFLSGADSSSHLSSSHVSSEHRELMKKDAGEGKWRKGGAEGRTEGGRAGTSSIEEEVPTAVNDSLCSNSIPSVVDEKGTGWQA